MVDEGAVVLLICTFLWGCPHKGWRGGGAGGSPGGSQAARRTPLFVLCGGEVLAEPHATGKRQRAQERDRQRHSHRDDMWAIEK